MDNSIRKAVLWDMDGTLIDGYELHFRSWIKAFGDSAPNFDREIFRLGYGSTNEVVIPFYLGYKPSPEEFERIDTGKEAAFRERAAEEAAPFPGVVNWLAWVKAQGHAQAIASSAPIENIEAILQAHDLHKYFDLYVSGVGLPSKPAPDIFLEAARRLGSAPNYAIVMEDARQGLAAGRAAGMVTIGLQNVNQLQLHEADMIIPDYLGDPAEILGPFLARMDA